MYTEFKAIVIGNELHLNKIAPHFGIQRKFKWEDPLLLKQDQLQGIVNDNDHKMVYLFHFGSVVCVNLQHHEILDVIHYLKRLEPEIDISQNFPYEDDYKLEVNTEADFSINNDSLVVDAQCDHHLEIIATILAKSVSLEKNENEVVALLDRIEAVVNNLSRGELGMTDSGLARMTANILRFRLNTISISCFSTIPTLPGITKQRPHCTMSCPRSSSSKSVMKIFVTKPKLSWTSPKPSPAWFTPGAAHAWNGRSSSLL